MNKPKVLVIGSNSFSGSHFVAEALGAGHAVWGVSRSPEPNPVFLPYRWPAVGKEDWIGFRRAAYPPDCMTGA